MSEPESYSFRRYLDAKQTVDERARDTRVETAFRSALADYSRLRICEIGAGTGTTAQAVHEWTDVPVEYHAVDVDRSLLDVATARAADTDERFEISAHVDDALDHLAAASEPYDVVIAQAFLDITDVRSAMAVVSESLAPGGIGYFPITFDGVTRFLPSVDAAFDDRIERRFHDHMDTTQKDAGTTGDSNAGRHLLTAIPATDGTVRAAGGSDWVVTPAGGYEGDEAYFLHHVVDIVTGALADDETIDAGRLTAWADQRHQQITAEELTYLTHQLDVLARWD